MMVKTLKEIGIWHWRALFILFLASPAANARIVALELDLPLDKVSSEAGPVKVGDHHRARIFYDDTTVDPKTHIVKVIQMQHLMADWTPAMVGDPSMPMTDAWLDLRSKPYRYHYRSTVVNDRGLATIVDFNEKARRMSILSAKDKSILLSAPYTVDSTPIEHVLLMVVNEPAITMLKMTVTLDQVAAGQRSKVGDTDRIRLVYDASAMNPRTKRVPLLNLQHFVNGEWRPATPDPVMMPVTDAWLDTSVIPYSLHFNASVVHGVPIIIEADEHTHRLSIRAPQDPSTVFESGAYEIDPTPDTGSEAIAAGTPPTKMTSTHATLP